MSTKDTRDTGLTPEQQALSDLWDEHVRDEFAIKDANAAVDTMTPDAYVNLVPVLIGGVGKEQVRQFYSAHYYSEHAARHRDRSDLPNDWFPIPGRRDDHSVYTHD